MSTTDDQIDFAVSQAHMISQMLDNYRREADTALDKVLWDLCESVRLLHQEQKNLKHELDQLKERAKD